MMTTDPLDDPVEVARILRPICIRDEHDPPPRHRETLATVRRVCLALVTLAVLTGGIVALAANAAAQSSAIWPRQAELRQDARDQADRAVDR